MLRGQLKRTDGLILPQEMSRSVQKLVSLLRIQHWFMCGPLGKLVQMEDSTAFIKALMLGESFTFECCDGSPGGPASVTNPNMLGWSEEGDEEGGQLLLRPCLWCFAIERKSDIWIWDQRMALNRFRSELGT